MAQIRKSKVISPSKIQQGHKRASKLVYGDQTFGATLRGMHISPQKARLVADQIRGLPVERAKDVLRFSNKRAAYLLDKVLVSALGNADWKTQGGVGASELFVAEAYCDEGSRLKRVKAGPMGRGRPILRRNAHLTVVLGVKKEEGKEAGAKEGSAAGA